MLSKIDQIVTHRSIVTLFILLDIKKHKFYRSKIEERVQFEVYLYLLQLTDHHHKNNMYV